MKVTIRTERGEMVTHGNMSAANALVSAFSDILHGEGMLSAKLTARIDRIQITVEDEPLDVERLR